MFTKDAPLRVAVVGAGPAGFYACEGLLRQQEIPVRVDLFDSLPTPYGLVRGGVAPDHPKIKSVSRLFDRTAEREGFRFFGNVCFGKDLLLADLLGCYHQLLFCCGCEGSRWSGIAGEQLAGCSGAAEFVGWYNGHPHHRHHTFDLSQVEAAVVIGNGNVALDVARILAKHPAELRSTDIAAHALQALQQSRLRTIYLVGRRGAAQAAFSNPELRQLGSLEHADLVVDPAQLELDPASQDFLAASGTPTPQRNLEWLQQHAKKPLRGCPRQLVLRFLRSPTAFLGEQRLEGVKLQHNVLAADENQQVRAQGLDVYETLPVQLALLAIGYRGSPLPDLPFDKASGTLVNQQGRVKSPADQGSLPGVYAAGWIKRGPSGVIGTNKVDALETVAAMLNDACQPQPHWASVSTAADAPIQLMREKGIRFVAFSEWQTLDALEIQRGQPDKVREKLVSIPAMIAALEQDG